MRGRYLALTLALGAALTGAAQAQDADRPTVVLVHGAFADGSSWNAVVQDLRTDGYPVVAAANPLRGVAADAASVNALLRSIDGPVVLVGHSYGGPVISVAAATAPNVKALVFVAAFAPEVGESVAELTALYPGSTLGAALSKPVELPGGDNDLYIEPARYPDQFAADVPAEQAALMAASQRPVTQAALEEEATAAAWKALPNYAIYGDADRNITPDVMAFMARRAAARRTTVLPGASHALMVSHPREVADLIETAANDR